MPAFRLHRRSITMATLFLAPKNFSRHILLNYMDSRELEQFDKALQLRRLWILEPCLAGLTDAL
jgi:hypothetical protein